MLRRLPILGCAGFVAFLFCALLWNLTVGGVWPRLRLRSAHPLAGATAPPSPPLTLDAILSGEAQQALSLSVGRALPVFSFAVRAKNQLLYSLFGVSGTPSVVVGKGGQLFEPGYIKEYCGRSGAPDAARVAVWAQTVGATARALEAGGKGFAYLVTPSKAARYPNNLPAGLACPAAARGSTDKLPPFLGALATQGVAPVDGAGLIEAHKGAYPIELFPRGGTHWNHLGAALAAREVQRRLDAGGRASIGPYEFDWRQTEEAAGTERDLLDLSNLLWPDAHYPTALVTGRGAGASCARAPRLLFVGGSFLREIIVALAQAPCPPQIDYWFYYATPEGRIEVQRHLTAPGEVGIGATLAAGPDRLREAVAAADAVLLEENESNISLTRQIGDLRAAMGG